MLFKGKIPNLTMCESIGFVKINFKKIILDMCFDLNAYAIGVFDEIRRALKGAKRVIKGPRRRKRQRHSFLKC
ncbi:MAG: hypothetical protein MR645_00455 [Paraprevotella sp.]|nr:hypothetical protein [Paraprevotella sp.]